TKEPEPVKVASSPPPPPPPHPAPFWIPRRVAGVGGAGFGLAAIGSAIVLGLSANDAKSAFDVDHMQESFDHASSLQTWTNVAFVSGAVFLIGGAALVLWPDPESGG